ncbi:hypothetical protein M595_1658 [Lyngbya aestuarii BL J]|uniref:Uncharacterized protein n=1 Tax=Lyngbya aestuarii BL J TaxID=1348334 RepID=U7QKL8_9CYAN|nr:hypothetical protein M595_1658 [Lyngbya aestuarii BL J]
MNPDYTLKQSYQTLYNNNLGAETLYTLLKNKTISIYFMPTPRPRIFPHKPSEINTLLCS